MKIENSEGKAFAVLLILFTAIAVLTGPIAIVILFRPFYYAHIDPLRLTEGSGLTELQIKQAFDYVMDYCIGKADDFSAGVLHWSQEGVDHFADVRGLFILDIWLAVLSCAVIVSIIIYCAVKGRKPCFFRGHSPGFWSAAGIGLIMIVIAVVSAVDFDRAFEAFHKIFFPGKDNWIFDSDTDPVIMILPQEFFRDCAILIFVIIIISCVALVAADHVILNKNRRDFNRNVHKK